VRHRGAERRSSMKTTRAIDYDDEDANIDYDDEAAA
jgi:hypothetical protein